MSVPQAPGTWRLPRSTSAAAPRVRLRHVLGGLVARAWIVPRTGPAPSPGHARESPSTSAVPPGSPGRGHGYRRCVADQTLRISSSRLTARLSSRPAPRSGNPAACPPVEPKPLSPRADSGRAGTSRNVTFSTRCTTNWATRSPRRSDTALVTVGVQQDHLDPATVPGVDGAWRVHQVVIPVLARQPRAGVHEPRIARQARRSRSRCRPAPARRAPGRRPRPQHRSAPASRGPRVGGQRSTPGSSPDQQHV